MILVKFLRIAGGVILILIGVILVIMPIVPGWVLIIPGIVLLAPEIPFLNKLLNKIYDKYPSSRKYLDKAQGNEIRKNQKNIDRSAP